MTEKAPIRKKYLQITYSINIKSKIYAAGQYNKLQNTPNYHI